MFDSSANDATLVLARFAATTGLESVPSVVRSRLKDCLLDFVGNTAYAAVNAESSAAFRAGAMALQGANDDATVVGDTQGYSYLQAALLNGAFAHTLDFDDTNVWGCLHPGAPVIAAAMVEAERIRATGKRWLAALAVGYEVATRIGAALGSTAYDRGFHITAVTGIFGAVAAVGRLRGVDSDTLASALGIAGSKAAGSMQYLANGSWNKRLHPGFAAHDALLALAFAQAGVVGAAAPIEGRYGLLAGYTNDATPLALTDRLGEWWPSGDTAIKPFPSCRLNHGAIEAALQLHEQLGTGARKRIEAALREGARLEVRLSPKAAQIVGEATPNKIHPRNIVDAQFSVYFQVAVTLLDGRCNWQSYQRIGAADVAALCSAIYVVIDGQLPIVGAVLSFAGQAVRIDEPLGEPSRPCDGVSLRRKFDDLAVPVFGERHTAQIAQRVAALEDETDASTLIRQFRGSVQ
jgi:2-methylcitrate dehydratase PrpD